MLDTQFRNFQVISGQPTEFARCEKFETVLIGNEIEHRIYTMSQRDTHTHTHTLSLSLSLSITHPPHPHTHTHTEVGLKKGKGKRKRGSRRGRKYTNLMPEHGEHTHIILVLDSRSSYS